MNNSVHETEQAELKQAEREGSPYENKVRSRIISTLTNNPKVTVPTLRSMCGMSLNPVFDTVLAYLIEDGVIEQTPIKFGLVVKGLE